jgi:hypothetical protein
MTSPSHADWHGPPRLVVSGGLGQVSRLGPNNGPTLFTGFHFPGFLILKYSKNYFKIPKFLEICRNLGKKIQSKFCLNPLKLIFWENLTKSSFSP